MNIKEQNGTVIMEFEGKLVGGSLTARIDKALENFIAKGKKKIVFDLGGITYLNSSGMGILLSSFSKVNDNGGVLKFANVTSKISGLFSNTKLNEIFEVYDTTEEAVNSFN
jgi:anti-sigma B factor antagonist